MTLERVHDDHKIELGLTVKDTQPSNEDIENLGKELYTAIHGLPDCQVAQALSFRAVWLKLELHGVEFNNRALYRPDISFYYIISKTTLRISSSVMFATVQPDYSNRYIQLPNEDECPIDEFDSCEQALCYKAAKTFLEAVYFLRSV